MAAKVVIAITGASGSIYAKIMIEKLQEISEQWDDIAIIFSEKGEEVWKFELEHYPLKNIPFKIYDRQDFYAPFASGSSDYGAMIICPCSMGTLGRIANGISDDLITRCADVMLKERRKLILVTRDSPLNLIQLRNMVSITEAGGIICPASPSFYSKPKNLDEVASTISERVLSLTGFTVKGYQWGKN